MLIRYPELLGAVVCQVPLLDMHRYSHLLAGPPGWRIRRSGQARGMGLPQAYSPYQNVKPGVTTRRGVHDHHPGRPGAPRPCPEDVRPMKAMGYDVRYFENIEGGHGAGADNRQTAHFWALAYTFLARTLMPVTAG